MGSAQNAWMDISCLSSDVLKMPTMTLDVPIDWMKIIVNFAKLASSQFKESVLPSKN